MIFYYSATGNSQHAAHRLAEALGDRVISIRMCLEEGKTSFDLAEGESLALVTPTYFMGLPTLVADFLDTLDLHIDGPTPYAYLVATFGNFSGTVRSSTETALHAKGIPIAAAFGVRMVDTWTPIFDVSNQERNLRITRAADATVDSIAAAVRTRATGSHHIRTGPPLVSTLIHTNWKNKRSTKPFFVKSTCIGCGLCEKTCPVSAIHIEGGRPVWVTDACAQCLSCLHRCPVFAIQHGPKTKGHGQWVYPGKASA